MQLPGVGPFFWVMCLLHVYGLLGKAAYWPIDSEDEGWLSVQVRAIMRQKKMTGMFREKLEELTLPKRQSLITIIYVFLITAPLSWYLNDLSQTPKDQEQRLLDSYMALWQVQTSIAAVAIPILLFVIELSKDHRASATRSHEILIRDTMIFPATVFSLLGVFRIGVDVAWFANKVVFVFDLVFVLLITLTMAMHAYYRALKLMFSPSTMKRRSMALMKVKMKESLDASIAGRIANRILFEKLSVLNIGFWVLTPDKSDQYLILRTNTIGLLSDIHATRLTEFVNTLPWKTSASEARMIPPESPETEDERCDDEGYKSEAIWIMKKIGEPVLARNDALLRLDKSKFNALDASKLESKMQNIFRILSDDEN
jgi:hypothetical protein